MILENTGVLHKTRLTRLRKLKATSMYTVRVNPCFLFGVKNVGNAVIFGDFADEIFLQSKRLEQNKQKSPANSNCTQAAFSGYEFATIEAMQFKFQFELKKVANSHNLVPRAFPFPHEKGKSPRNEVGIASQIFPFPFLCITEPLKTQSRYPYPTPSAIKRAC